MPDSYVGGPLRRLDDLRSASEEGPLLQIGDIFQQRDALEKVIKEANEVMGKRVQTSNRVDSVNGLDVKFDGRKNPKYLTAICSSSGCSHKVKCTAKLDADEGGVTWVIRGDAQSVEDRAAQQDSNDEGASSETPEGNTSGAADGAADGGGLGLADGAADVATDGACLTHSCTGSMCKEARKSSTNYSREMVAATFVAECDDRDPKPKLVQDLLSKYTFLELPISVAKRVAEVVKKSTHGKLLAL